MPVIWRLNGLNRMNQEFTSLSEHHRVVIGSLDVSDSAGKCLEKCMPDCGGKRTEPGYKNSTCDLANLLGGGLGNW
ncbi:hypothetical protein F0562_024185 [Nyssa sinensis]|uniref:Uncharacterized protein n=1 Tax=Nyssa sinensis TaxID=561372 RepID=A0A5J5BED1_9ASTE|nr:hypothetical protein F0562_024185 [Nyssa sinensis]